MLTVLRKLLPLQGHKCAGVFVKFEVNCECGWYSLPHSERRQAYSEWRSHVRDCGGQYESWEKAHARRDRELAKAMKCVETRHD